jgi:DNA-binding response OmpR family regulator
VDGWLADVASRLLMVNEGLPYDATARELVLDGQRSPLTPLELGVLRLLHEREGRVVRRDELRRQVWGHDWDGGANVVDVVVSALRRKLGPRAGALETVRGVGYRLGSLR